MSKYLFAVVAMATVLAQPALAAMDCGANLDKHSVMMIQLMVVAGLGCTTIPEFAITHPGLLWRPLVDPEVSRTVNLVTVRGRQHGPAVGALVHAVKRHRWEAIEETVSADGAM